MKKTSNKLVLTALWVALGSVTPVSWTAEEYPPMPDSMGSKGGCYMFETKANAPTAINRASHLVGMPVRNPAGDRLGKIKDLVIDWESGQASYAVLARNGFQGKTDKYVAVPLTAFAPSDSRRYLLLNADKSSVVEAKGFALNQWPSPSSPAWGAEPFWKERTDAKSTTLPERKEMKLEPSEPEHPEKIESPEPDPEQPQPPEPEHPD